MTRVQIAQYTSYLLVLKMELELLHSVFKLILTRNCNNSIIIHASVCCCLLAAMCDWTYTGKWKLFPEMAFFMSSFMPVLELGSKVDTYVSYFLYAAHFWRVTLSVFHLSWFSHVNNSSKSIIRSFYKPGFLDRIEQNILVLAGGLNWLFPMNPQHYCFWLS